MRAIAITPERTLELVDIEPDVVGPGDVRVNVSYCGICGSDLHYLESPDLGPAGTVMGHELSGVVVELGTQVVGLALGDRVTVNPFAFCGECRPCREGLPNLCERRPETRLGGLHRRGAFATSVVVPASTAFPLPDGLSDEHAALAEPLAVGAHAVALSGTPPDAPVAVLGGGPIGVMTCLALTGAGFDRVVCVELNAGRREQLETYGITTVSGESASTAVPDLLGGDPVTVFDCTGHPSGLTSALDLLGYTGQVILVGYSVEPAPIPTYRVVAGEISIKGAAIYTHEDFSRAIEQLAAGRFPSDDVITSVRGFADAQEVFADLMSGASRQMKVLLKP